jgi:hypothetical protein
MSGGQTGGGNVGYQMGMPNNSWQQQLGGGSAQPQPSPWQQGGNAGAVANGQPIPSQAAPGLGTIGQQPGYSSAPPPGYHQPSPFPMQGGNPMQRAPSPPGMRVAYPVRSSGIAR